MPRFSWSCIVSARARMRVASGVDMAAVYISMGRACVRLGLQHILVLRKARMDAGLPRLGLGTS